MSRKTTVLLNMSVLEISEEGNRYAVDRYPVVEALNAALRGQQPWAGEFHALIRDDTPVVPWHVGYLLGNDFKSLSVPDLLELIRQQAWEDPDCLQLLVQDEEDDGLTLSYPLRAVVAEPSP